MKKRFTEFAIDQKLIDIITDAGFETCTDVQAETFTHSLEGKDLCVQSQTGTGKTAAFLISIYQLFLAEKTKTKKALILVPTRELAIQIEEEAVRLMGDLGYTVASIFGGVGYGKQEQQLREGINIMIGTPGRLIDFMKSGKLMIKDISCLVLDEADRMLDMGFYPDIREILKRAPAKDQRQTMLFSATLRTKVKNLAWKFMNDPVEVAIEPESVTVKEISQELYHVSKEEKVPILLGLIQREKPENMLIFTNTKHGAIELTKRLQANGIESQYIMGDLPQKKRTKVISDLKSGRIACLVATDVAARGLHVDDLDLVVNYDLPEDCENYVHRIGRTARAGKSGKAISLACEKYVFGLESIEKYINMKIPVAWADESLFVADKSAGMSFRESRYGTGNRGQGHRDSRGRSDRRSGSRPGSRPSSGGQARSRKPDNRTGIRKPAEGRKPAAGWQKKSAQSARSRPFEDRDKNRKPSGKPGQNRDRNRGGNRQQQNRQQQGGNQGPARSKKIEDRLEMYKQKYGEDFTVKKQPEKQGKNKGKQKGQENGQNKSLIKSVLGKLRKKKNK